MTEGMAMPITARELISMLSELPNLDVEVTASDTYGEGTFPILGMIYDSNSVELTGESHD